VRMPAKIGPLARVNWRCRCLLFGSRFGCRSLNRFHHAEAAVAQLETLSPEDRPGAVRTA